MASDNSHTHFSSSDIEKYHQGLLSPSERHALEKAALDDPFLADALEGYGTVKKPVAADLADLQARLHHRTGQAKVIPLVPGNKKKLPWLRIAAMILLLAGAGLLANKFLFDRKQEAGPITKLDLDTVTTNTSSSWTQSNQPVDSTQPSIVTSTTPGTGANTEYLQTGPKDSMAGSLASTATPLNYSTDKLGATTPPAPQIQEPPPVKPVSPIIAEANDKDLSRSIAGNRRENSPVYRRQNDPGSIEQKKKTFAVTETVNMNDQYYNNQVNRSFNAQVLDNNNRPLPFARVTNVHDNVGTYANRDGYFTLTSPDSVLNVKVENVGFEDNVVKLRSDVSSNRIVMNDDRSAGVVLSTQKVNAAKRSRDANLKVEEPEPADGWENYDVYLANNLNVPPDITSKEGNAQREVEISFEVDKQGEPVKFKVEKSLCKSCDEEAIRLIREGPKWKRKAKKGRTTVTITF